MYVIYIFLHSLCAFPVLNALMFQMTTWMNNHDFNAFMEKYPGHVSDMLGYINQYDAVGADRLSALTQNFQSMGYDMEKAQTMAYRMLEGALYKQQALVTYDQGFLMVGFTILLCIPIVLLIRYNKTEKHKWLLTINISSLQTQGAKQKRLLHEV